MTRRRSSDEPIDKPLWRPGDASRSGRACVRLGADNGSALVPLLTVCSPSFDCVLGRDNKIGCFQGFSTGATGLEPATSGVTGRRSNQLNYAPQGDGQCSRVAQ